MPLPDGSGPWEFAGYRCQVHLRGLVAAGRLGSGSPRF